MGAAAYARGTKVLRQEIDSDFRARAEENRRLGIFDPVVILQDQHANEMNAANERINALEKELAQKSTELQRVTAERDAAIQRAEQAESYTPILFSKIGVFEHKWLKCSAILSLLKLYDRERYDELHYEAMHDHPELWLDVERDALNGWPVRGRNAEDK